MLLFGEAAASDSQVVSVVESTLMKTWWGPVGLCWHQSQGHVSSLEGFVCQNVTCGGRIEVGKW